MNRSMSSTAAMLTACAALAFAAQPASAKDTAKGKMTPDAAEGVCGEKDGTYFESPDKSNYGCGYKGGGGLLCDKDTGCTESDGIIEEGQEPLDRKAPWGLLGLLGLAGLLGLNGRKRRDADPLR